MKGTKPAHSWDPPPREAVAIQEALARQVIREAEIGEISVIGRVDAGYRAGVRRAAIVGLSFPDLEIPDCTVATRALTYKWIIPSSATHMAP